MIVIVFWIIIIIFRLYYQESWSQTRGIWSDAWWEVYHCLFGSELLVSICLKSKHILAKNCLLSKGGPEHVKKNKPLSPEFEKSTERGSCSRWVRWFVTCVFLLVPGNEVCKVKMLKCVQKLNLFVDSPWNGFSYPIPEGEIVGSAAKCKEKLHLNVAVNFLSFI